MSQELARFPGPRQLLWITYGIPSSMKMTEGWIDLKPRLRQLAAQFVHGGIAVYTLDPGLILGTLLDGLEVLSAATGGRAFSSSDLKMALNQMGTMSRYLFARLRASVSAETGSALHTVRLTSSRKGVTVLASRLIWRVRSGPLKVASKISATLTIPPEPCIHIRGTQRSPCAASAWFWN